MALIPVTRGQTFKPQTTGRLKAVIPQQRAPQPRPDVRQSSNYLNALQGAEKYKQEAQQASSFKGMAGNTLRGVGSAALNFGKEILRTPLTIPLKVTQTLTEGITKKPQVYTPQTKVEKFFYGDQPRQSYLQDQAGIQRWGQEKGLGRGSSVALGAAGAGAEVLADLLPAGFGGKVLKAIKGNQILKPIASKQLSKLGSRKIAQTESLLNFPKATDQVVSKSSYTKTLAQPKVNVKQLSKQATNSLENETTGIKPGAVERAKKEIQSGTSRPIRTRDIDGKTFIEDGRHRLQAYKELGKKEIPIEDVTQNYQSQPLQEGGIVNGGKQRGFIESVKNSPETSQDLASRVEGFYDVKHNKPVQEKAQRLIFDNINEAERIAKSDISDTGVITGNELVKHYDSIAINAKKTGDMATFEQAMNKATDLVKNQARNLTEAGRTVQAASTISKMSPEGILHYLNKVGGVKLTNEKSFDFMRKAEGIQNILDPRERAFRTFDLIDELADSIPRGGKDKLLEALNLPRSIMATADLSAPFRQGIFTAARNPKMFAKNFGKMFKYAFSEDAYRNLKADIITSPNYNLYQKYKLPLTDTAAGLSGREEQFMSQMAEKIPLFGKLAKGSNRSYTGFLNKMRVDLFDDFVKTAELNGIKDEKFFESAARFVGAATGRGNLYKTLEGSANALNAVFFSPRLMASRMSLINPLYYAKLHPAVRKEALKSLAAFVGTGISVLSLAKLGGADVSADPRSADFGKIKIGNTRFDIWGGFQQYARLIGQLTTGEKISTITGKQTNLGEGFNAPTRKSISYDFFESKMAPIASLISRATEGTKFGEKFNLPAELIDRFIPMIASDAFDLYREKGVAGIPMAVPGAFGVGSQTYGDQVPMLGKTAIGNPSVKWRSQPGLGETILNKITGKQLTNIPQDQWSPLLKERTAEQKRQVELDAAKQDVLNTGEPKYVGDTFIFLDNGIVKTKVITPTKRKPLESELKKSNLQPFYGN